MAERISAREFERLAGMPLRPLTRVRMSDEAVRRANKALHRARLRHADAIIAARDAGHSLAEIGQVLKPPVTPQRVWSLIKWAEEQQQQKEPRK